MFNDDIILFQFSQLRNENREISHRKGLIQPLSTALRAINTWCRNLQQWNRGTFIRCTAKQHWSTTIIPHIGNRERDITVHYNTGSPLNKVDYNLYVQFFPVQSIFSVKVSQCIMTVMDRPVCLCSYMVNLNDPKS